MLLILIIDVIVVGGLVFLTMTKGLERALPFFAFVVVLLPDQCSIPLPGAFRITAQRIALVTLFALFLVAGRRGQKGRARQRLPLRFLILLSVVWLCLSCANSVVPVVSLKVAISELIEYYLLYYILMRSITDQETVPRILSGIVGALIFASILGMGEMHSLWEVSDWFPAISHRFFVVDAVSERGARIQSTFPHPIHYGAALAIAIPLALYLISRSQSRARRAFLWGGVLLMFYNIYKTGSRGPWLALALSFVCVFVLCRRQLRRYILGIVFLTILVLVVRPGVLTSLVNDYNATTNINTQEGASYSYRYALFRVSQNAVDRNPSRALWGYGPESFFFLDLHGPFLGYPDWSFLSCDSTWIGFMVDTGYVGLFIMALLLLSPAFLGFRDYRQLEMPSKELSAIFFTTLVAFYFMMISVAMYSWGQIGYLLWILIALSLAHGRLARNKLPAPVYDIDTAAAQQWELSDIGLPTR